MIIGYARPSNHDNPLARQLEVLGCVGADKIVVESASGASRERPELSRCLGDLRMGDTVVVCSLDRLARSLKDLVRIISILQAKGVRFHSIAEGLDTSSPNGGLIVHVFNALADFERSAAQERTKEGLETARARGRKGGRPPKMSLEDIRMARVMLSEPGVTKVEVARHFNVSRVTLDKALRDDILF